MVWVREDRTIIDALGKKNSFFLLQHSFLHYHLSLRVEVGVRLDVGEKEMSLNMRQ